MHIIISCKVQTNQRLINTLGYKTMTGFQKQLAIIIVDNLDSQTFHNYLFSKIGTATNANIEVYYEILDFF